MPSVKSDSLFRHSLVNKAMYDHLHRTNVHSSDRVSKSKANKFEIAKNHEAATRLGYVRSEIKGKAKVFELVFVQF